MVQFCSSTTSLDEFRLEMVKKAGHAGHACHPSTWEAEAGKLHITRWSPARDK